MGHLVEWLKCCPGASRENTRNKDPVAQWVAFQTCFGEGVPLNLTSTNPKRVPILFFHGNPLVDFQEAPNLAEEVFPDPKREGLLPTWDRCVNPGFPC